MLTNQYEYNGMCESGNVAAVSPTSPNRYGEEAALHYVLVLSFLKCQTFYPEAEGLHYRDREDRFTVISQLIHFQKN